MLVVYNGLMAALCAKVWLSNKYGDGPFCLESRSVGLDDGYFGSYSIYSYSYLTVIDSCIVTLKRNESNHRGGLDTFVWLTPFAPVLIH
jgi:hypothetical protein